MSREPLPAPARGRSGRTLDRRTLLRGLLIGGPPLMSATLSGCSRPDQASGTATAPGQSEPAPRAATTNAATGAVLLAFFSRAGENYSYGDRADLEVGNTKVLAGMIADRIGCDLHEIQAVDPYPADYDATVERNVAEQNADARPAIANPLPPLAGYDTVLLASPIWNVRPPMIMRTFAEALDFAGTTVHPITTHALSGLGRAVDDYTQACPGARIGEGLAVRGETVRESGAALDAWLTRTGLN